MPSTPTISNPPITDSTGQSILNILTAIKNSIQPADKPHGEVYYHTTSPDAAVGNDWDIWVKYEDTNEWTADPDYLITAGNDGWYNDATFATTASNTWQKTNAGKAVMMFITGYNDWGGPMLLTRESNSAIVNYKRGPNTTYNLSYSTVVIDGITYYVSDVNIWIYLGSNDRNVKTTSPTAPNVSYSELGNPSTAEEWVRAMIAKAKVRSIWKYLEIYIKLNGSWIGCYTVERGISISDLKDVTLTSLADGNILKWDSASSKWINDALGSTGVYIGTTDPDPSTGEECDTYYKIGTISEVPITFNYLKMVVTAKRTSSEGHVQLSRVDLLDDSDNLYSWSGTTVSATPNTYSVSEGPANLIDGSTSTKFCVDTGSNKPTSEDPLSIIFTLGTPIVSGTYTKWKWYTANDSTGRDPITFSLYGSEDGTEWELLDSAVSETITETRQTLAYTGDISEITVDIIGVVKQFIRHEDEWLDGYDRSSGGNASINGVLLSGNKTSADLGITIRLTQAEYDSLPEADKADPNKTYYIYDADPDPVEVVNYFGCFMDVSKVIKESTAIIPNTATTYTATQDCAVRVTIANASDNSSYINISNDGTTWAIAWSQYSSSSVEEYSLLVYMKKGQTIKMNQTFTGHNGSYTVFGLQSGSNIFHPVIYSTTEREIGVWTDGKPLYQKTINFGAFPNNATKTVPHNISNIDYVVSAIGYGDNGTQYFPIPFVNNDIIGSQVMLYVTKSDIVARTSVDRSSFSKCYVTIQYTKTTDTAGSGSWTPQGVPTVCYDDTERLVGSWFGEPLYQKTIRFDCSDTSNIQTAYTIPNTDTIVQVLDAYFQNSSNSLNQQQRYTWYKDHFWSYIVNNSGHVISVHRETSDGNWQSGVKFVITIQYTKS